MGVLVISAMTWRPRQRLVWLMLALSLSLSCRVASTTAQRPQRQQQQQQQQQQHDDDFRSDNDAGSAHGHGTRDDASGKKGKGEAAPTTTTATASVSMNGSDATTAATTEKEVRVELAAGAGARGGGGGGTRFSTEDEANFSPRLLAMLRKPCEAYARNILDEPALHLQHAAVIFLRHKCRHEPSHDAATTSPGRRTSHPCADLANAVSIELTHKEASEVLRQLLHERCQSEAVILSSADATRSADAASFLVTDTVRRVAEEEQEFRDYAGTPVDREEIAKRPRMPEDGPLLLDDGGEENEKQTATSTSTVPSFIYLFVQDSFCSDNLYLFTYKVINGGLKEKKNPCT